MATVELIRSGEEITADWLTQVLRSSGAIDDATGVRSVTVASMGDEGGLLSDLFRVAVAYDGGDGPERVIVKFPIGDETQRFTADILGFYARELAFYDRIADAAPFGTARIHGHAMAADSTDFVLVMEDLGHLHKVEQRAGASLDDARACLSAMAAFHVRWWEDPAIPELSETFLPIVNDVYLGALPGVFAGGWPGAQEHGADLLTPEVIAFGDRFGELVPWLLEEMSTPATFVHGDWRGDNVFLGGDRGVTMIDFQISGFAVGLYDVAYFLGGSVDSDVRSGQDEALVRHYLAELAANGVDYPFEEAWAKYRTVLCHCLIYGVSSFASWEAWNEDQRAVLRVMLARTVRAIAETDALSVLPPA